MQKDIYYYEEKKPLKWIMYPLQQKEPIELGSKGLQRPS